MPEWGLPLNGAVRKRIHETLTFERYEWTRFTNVCIKNIPGRANSKCKGPEVNISGIYEEQYGGLFNRNKWSEVKNRRDEVRMLIEVKSRLSLIDYFNNLAYITMRGETLDWFEERSDKVWLYDLTKIFWLLISDFKFVFVCLLMDTQRKLKIFLSLKYKNFFSICILVVVVLYYYFL